jgi:hypothetical protein
MYRLEAKACAGEGIEEVRGLAPKKGLKLGQKLNYRLSYPAIAPISASRGRKAIRLDLQSN